MRIVSLAFVACLMACTAPQQQGARMISDAATGTHGVLSQDAPAGPSITARAGYEMGAGYAVFLDRRASEWLHPQAVYVDGRQLAYVATESVLIGCQNGCKIRESGIIRLPYALFSGYAQTGMRYTLSGRAARQVTGIVPADLFRQVIEAR